MGVKKKFQIAVMLAGLCGCLAVAASVFGTTADAAPWDPTAKTIMGWFTGKTVIYVGVIAAAVAIISHMAGEGRIAKAGMAIAFGVAFLGTAEATITAFFGDGAALVPETAIEMVSEPSRPLEALFETVG